MINLARSMVRSAPIAAAFVICLWAGDADAWWWEPAPNISSVQVSHDQHNMRLNVRYNFNRVLSGTMRSATAGRIAPHTAGRIAGLTAGNTAGSTTGPMSGSTAGVRSLPHAESRLPPLPLLLPSLHLLGQHGGVAAVGEPTATLAATGITTGVGATGANPACLRRGAQEAPGVR